MSKTTFGVSERGPVRPRLPAAAALAALVGLSAVVQTLLAWARPTPGYFPDEYIYAELGRSLAETGRPLVRDGASHFAPLLYPLLTAPAWLIDEVATAYRAVQALDALVMSTAAVPVYLIGRRLALGRGLALICAACALAAPALLYPSWVMAEPLAYPLALAAVACAIVLLDRPTLGLQILLLALSGLAVLTRVQLAAIPLVYLVAAVTVGVRTRGLRSLVAERRLSLGVVGALVAVAGVAGLRGHFGYYPSFTYVTVAPLDALEGLGANALVLAYSAGWVLVPPALLGLALALARPRSRVELAFGSVAAPLVALLLLQASLYGDTENVQERYVFYAVPLLVLACALYARRGWPLLRAHALLAAVAAAVASLVPLAGYAAAQGSAQSLLLSAHQALGTALGDAALASLVFAGAATVLSAAVLALLWLRPARATSFMFAATLAAMVGLTAAAFTFYEDRRGRLRAELLPTDRSWVDAAGVGEVTLLVAPRGTRADTHTTLFWNRSVDRVVLLPPSTPPDVFAAGTASIDGAGRLTVAGEPVRGPLLADGYGTWLELQDARVLRRGPTKTLWQPAGGAQLRLAMVGRYYDGLIAAEGAVTVWPTRPGGRLAGRLELALDAPAGWNRTAFRLRLPGGRTLARPLPPGSRRLLRVPVCGRGVWKASFEADAVAVIHGGRVGPRGSRPRFVADASAC